MHSWLRSLAEILRLCYGRHGCDKATYGCATVARGKRWIFEHFKIIFEHFKIRAAEETRIRKRYGPPRTTAVLLRVRYGCTTDEPRIVAEENRSASLAQAAEV